MAHRILLVEDDTALRGGLTELFEREGYAVTQAASAREARERLNGGIELVVLDVTLPDGDGVRLCADWRAEGARQAILFLTAKDEEFDVVRALDAGGNDYVTKPFRMMELLSRMRALLRRSDEAAPAGPRGGIEIDAARMQVKKDGQAVPLTLTEYRILATLTRRRGVIPRERLLEALWDDEGRYIDDNTLSVHVSRLREKIGAEHIRTIRGVGYQWED
ncbi:MAG: response regulator transcription factor [Clostridia bacterium]|nr:response regulator transcription factor [Clostridia bacterium]MBO4885160.1 response regulator transcription factor [Clostridia bacterium]